MKETIYPIAQVITPSAIKEVLTKKETIIHSAVLEATNVIQTKFSEKEFDTVDEVKGELSIVLRAEWYPEIPPNVLGEKTVLYLSSILDKSIGISWQIQPNDLIRFTFRVN